MASWFKNMKNVAVGFGNTKVNVSNNKTVVNKTVNKSGSNSKKNQAMRVKAAKKNCSLLFEGGG